MKTKFFTFCTFLVSVLVFSYQKASAQQWLTAGNNLVGGEKLGSLNSQPLNIVTNNTTRIYVTPTGRVGIGTSTPLNILTVQGGGSSPINLWAPSTAIFTVLNEAANTDQVLGTAANSATGRPILTGRKARGTLAVPTLVNNNDGLFSFIASGHDGTTFQNTGAFEFFVEGPTSSANIPTRFLLSTGSNSSNRTARLKVGSTGNFTFNNTQLFLEQSTGALSMGSVTPTGSSILDINSTTKGVLLPRMTAAQRNAIASPATGLLIYQTDGTPGFYYYSGAWNPIGSAPLSGANTTLSNLTAPTAINTDLLPGSSGLFNLGSASFSWKDIYYSGDIVLQGNRFISTRGSNNFFGTLAGNPAITGSYNTATGTSALATNVTGNWNTADGYTALTNANNSYSNTGVGFQALLANTTGSYNTATGVLALGSNTTGVSNSATGVAALNGLTSGSYNSAIGYFAGANLPSGSFNTYLGSYADGPSSVAISNATAIGYNAAVTGSNSVRLGNTSVTSIGGQVNWTAFSDGRFKRNIKENVPGLDFVNKLRPVTYNLDIDGIDKVLRPTPAGEKKSADAIGTQRQLTTEDALAKQEKAKIKYTGFIAQEVEETVKKMNYDFSGVDAPKNSKDFYGLRYGDFVVPLVKAVQELSKKNEYLVEQNKEIKQENGEIKARLEKIEALLSSANLKDNATNTSLNNISLEQNDPNPFGSTTRISYNVPIGFKSAQLVITDITGKALKSVSLQKAGRGLVNVDATILTSGAYNYTLIVDGKIITSKKMIVAK